MREKTTEYLSQAAQALSEQDPQGAARWLRFASQDPALQGDESAFAELLTSVAGIGGQMQMADLEQKAQGALSGSPQALYDLGYQLIEVGLPKVAVPVLQRLNEGLPGKKAVVSELACALERSDVTARPRTSSPQAPPSWRTFGCATCLSSMPFVRGTSRRRGRTCPSSSPGR